MVRFTSIVLFLTHIACSAFAADAPLLPVKVEQKWGYIRVDGTLAIAPQFDSAGQFAEGLAPIRFNNEWGFIDTSGNIAITPRFSQVRGFTEGLANVYQDQKWGYIDRSGKLVIAPQFESAAEFSDGLAAVDIPGGKDTFYVNKAGTVTIRRHFIYASTFRNGLAAVTEALTNQDIRMGRMTSLRGFIDQTGKYVIPPSFELADDFSEGRAGVVVAGGVSGNQSAKWGYIDQSGKVVIAPQFDYADRFKEGFARVKIAGKEGLIDKEGNFLVKPQYPQVGSFSQGIAFVYLQDSSCRYIDNNGVEIFKVPSGNVCGAVLPSGVIPLVRVNDAVATLQRNSHDSPSISYLDKQGHVIWPKVKAKAEGQGPRVEAGVSSRVDAGEELGAISPPSRWRTMLEAQPRGTNVTPAFVHIKIPGTRCEQLHSANLVFGIFEKGHTLLSILDAKLGPVKFDGVGSSADIRPAALNEVKGYIVPTKAVSNAKQIDNAAFHLAAEEGFNVHLDGDDSRLEIVRSLGRSSAIVPAPPFTKATCAADLYKLGL